LAEKVKVVVNRAFIGQPVKLTVTAPLPVEAGAMLPTATGNALVTDGEHAAPPVCVRLRLLIWAVFAAPGPALLSVMVQARALWGPEVPIISPDRLVFSSPKFAVTVAGPLRDTVAVVALVGLVRVPLAVVLQFLNT